VEEPPQPYDLLSEEAVDTIHEQAMTILRRSASTSSRQGQDIFAKAGMKSRRTASALSAPSSSSRCQTPATFELQWRGTQSDR